MPLPELPITVDDPTHDTQRDGERVDKPFHSSHQGRDKQNAPAADKQAPGAIRYKD